MKIVKRSSAARKRPLRRDDRTHRGIPPRDVRTQSINFEGIENVQQGAQTVAASHEAEKVAASVMVGAIQDRPGEQVLSVAEQRLVADMHPDYELRRPLAHAEVPFTDNQPR
jgi:hypothetical protein